MDASTRRCVTYNQKDMLAGELSGSGCSTQRFVELMSSLKGIGFTPAGREETEADNFVRTPI